MSQPRRIPKIARGIRPRHTATSRHAEPMVRPTALTIFKKGIKNGKIAALILLIAGLWTIWFVLSSPRFLVNEPTVVNNRSVTQAEIVGLADVHDRAIWNIKPEQVAARVAQNPYIYTATVDLRLPNVVLIQVQEREAVIVWNSLGNNYEVTADGVVLGPSKTITNTTLIIYDTRQIPIEIGANVDIDALDLAQALNLRVPAEIGWTPTRYEWDPYYGLSIFNNTQQIVFGRLNDKKVSLDQKLAILKKITEGGEAWTFLDVRPEKPYYRPVVTPTATPENGE